MALEHLESGEVAQLSWPRANPVVGKTAVLAKTPHFEAIRLVVPAGNRIPPHRVRGAITLQGLAGTARFFVDGVERSIGAGDWLYLEGGAEHALEGVEDAVLLLTILFDRAPGPEEFDDAEIRQRVAASYERCVAGGRLFDVFYQILLAKDDEVAEKFVATDFVKQKRHLRAALELLVHRNIDDPRIRTALEHIGQTHSRTGYDIRPPLYSLWLDSLCEAVARTDPEYVPRLEVMWRRRLRPGIEFVASMYELPS